MSGLTLYFPWRHLENQGTAGIGRMSFSLPVDEKPPQKKAMKKREGETKTCIEICRIVSGLHMLCERQALKPVFLNMCRVLQ